MATALCGGIVRNCQARFSGISACDPSPQARASFTAATGVPCVEAATPELTGEAGLIILAVKPQSAAAACAALPPLPPQCMVFSICAGLTLAKLHELTGMQRRIRVMPNTPLLVGCGASCFAMADPADDEARTLSAAILGSAGKVWEVSEDELDAVTALSGSGPAYFFAFVEALRAGGEALGLNGELAEALAIQTMCGAAGMLQAQQGTPAELREAVTSKGGTTAAALEVMRQQRFPELVAQLMAAAAERSRELGK